MCVLWLSPWAISHSQIFVCIPTGQTWWGGGSETCPPSELFKQVNSLFLIPPFPRPPPSIKPVPPFTSDLIRLATFALLGRTPDESLLHLVLCCRLHLPTGIAPAHARLCPSAIHSDFVQLVNLASPPCWELRQRERKEEGVRRRRWRRRRRSRNEGVSAEEWGGNQKFVFFFFFNWKRRSAHGLNSPRTHIREPSHTSLPLYERTSYFSLTFHMRLEHQ